MQLETFVLGASLVLMAGVVALVLGITLLSLLWAAVTWWRFSYVVGEGSVVVTRGLVTRSVRTVPLDGDRVLVAAGVEAGTRVVTQGVELLGQIR